MASGKGSPSEYRIRDNLTNTLTRKFVETMKDYQNIQTKYRSFIKRKVERQVHIVKPEATSGRSLACGTLFDNDLLSLTHALLNTEEIDAVMRSGMGADHLITQAILKVSPSV